MRVERTPLRDVISHRTDAGRVCCGAVLLEVILALALFVGAAAVLTSGLSSSMDGVERLRLSAHAADFAVTILSELQMGTLTLDKSGPQPFEPPKEGWTWEAIVTPLQAEAEENSALQRIEVVVRHDDPPLVYRLNQILRSEDLKTRTEGRGIDSF